MTGPNRRRDRTEHLLAGYVSGPEAATEATARALPQAMAASAVILVEGVSDQIAVETAAGITDRPTGADTVVLPMGGAQAIVRVLPELLAGADERRVVGLCDEAEVPVFCRAVTAAGLGPATTASELAAVGFHTCVEDLEAELIRANGVDGVLAVLETEDDLGSFATMQKQPAWRGRSAEDQLRRFLGAGQQRKLRYARLLIEALGPGQLPPPVAAVLDEVHPIR